MKPVKSVRREDRAVKVEEKKVNKLSRSGEVRISVTEKLTESFKAGRKASLSQISTGTVCVMKRKLPISVSNYLVLGKRAEEVKVSRPRPAINTRTFFNRHALLREGEESRRWWKRRSDEGGDGFGQKLGK